MTEMKITFEKNGGQFITPIEDIKAKLKNIKAYIFDWDGVFNSGEKGESKSSNFSEVDAMGTNMLRLGYWLSNENTFPVVSIITGENNKMAIYLAERECFNHVYFSFKNKAVAFKHLLETYNLKPEEVAFCFDDVLDLSLTRLVGLRFMIGRKGSPLFEKYAIKNKQVDYITGQTGGNFAIREIMELILGLLGQYDEALDVRMAFDGTYSNYLEQRNKYQTKKFKYLNEEITLIE